MRLMNMLGWAGFAALFLPVFASCSHSPEGFCESWVEETCQAVTGCCDSDEKFDLEECRIALSSSCQQKVDVEKIHSGEHVFDQGAAKDCLGQIETCDDAAKVQKKTFEHDRACGLVITGFRPLGAACGSSDECQKAGEYATCYTGIAASGNGGICAAVVLDDKKTCSFSFDTNELHVCPDQTYCDLSDLKPNPSDPPSTRAFVYSAPCKSYPAAGEKCNNGVPCADGLYCKASGTGSVCTQRKAAGTSCTSQNECADGLSCLPDADGGVGTKCTKATNGLYCFTPPRCGDGNCDSNETPTSCPKDCGGGAVCGDGHCDLGETVACPQDCGTGAVCGDGQCDPGETVTCPQDCGGGTCTDSCAAAVTQGEKVCAGGAGETSYADLETCACGSCSSECAGFCAGGAIDSTCATCANTSCQAELTSCSNN